ncbi:MAG: ABC transporter ATP-binding protein [Pseudomonadota bacterium]
MVLQGSAPRDQAAALNIANLHLWYGKHHALKGVDLDVERGEFVALLGPSGCGKTSLLRSIAGFVHPRDGAIRLNGRDVAELPPRLRNIGLVFQSYALFPHLSALDNVRFGLECRKINARERAERAQRALALVGLDAFADRRPRELSGGQQQRVALARALVIEPDLLLLDEPLGALDKQLRVQMQTELKQLQKRFGVTALFVTHDQEEAMSMADRIVVMRDGLIEQVGAPEQLFAAPRTAWICNFMGSGNVLDGVIERLPDGRSILRVADSLFALEGAKPGERVTAFVRADRLALTAADGAGLTVTGRRFLGVQVELLLEGSGTPLRALLSVEAAARFPLGTAVRADAAAGDCRMLAPD